MIRAVIFDMFETLVTLCGNDHYFSENMAEDAKVPVKEFQNVWWQSEYDRSSGKMTTKEGIGLTLQTFGVYSEELAEKMYQKRVESKRRVFREEYLHPGVFPMLKALKDQGVQLAVISNCYNEEAQAIRDSKIFPYLDTAILSYEQKCCKPEKEIFEICLKELALSAEECLYVGDGGSRELEAAKEVGMHPLQATWYFREGSNQPCGRKNEFDQAQDPMDVVEYMKTR